MVVDCNEGLFSDEVLVYVFCEIMLVCLVQQELLKIGYFGLEGMFSQQVVFKYFGCLVLGLLLVSIEEVFQEVEVGNVDFGVVLVENLGQGIIQIILDMFFIFNLKICGEVELCVQQYLMLCSGWLDDVECVYGYFQLFMQIFLWLCVNLFKVERILVLSNVEGVCCVCNVDDVVVIGGESVGYVYGLKKVVIKLIQNDVDNIMCFLVVGCIIFFMFGYDCILVLVFIYDKFGVLFDVFSLFVWYGISMNCIELCLLYNVKWEYGFFIDLVGYIDDLVMQVVLVELEVYLVQIKVLGLYLVVVF